ncbi:SWIRM domain-containing protein [Fusarium falciforme]|uniref:SWIRM domain-containing protein n=1 Tax=Fusarium falciforme TaxID=195108 RepID=UPI0023014B6C|nr:SWIRM domain-containing protein [Fusarium falciforme]WAO87160.1 SWIRM domain-containing protein [Fusarium falciforme]
MADKPHSGYTCAMQPSTTFDKNSSSNKPTQFKSSPFFSPSSLFSSPFHQLPSINTNTTTMATNAPHSAQALNSMGPPAHPASSMASKKYDLSSLMSPPDQVHDSFNHGHHQSDISKPATSNNSSKHPMPMSPPISPYSKAMSTAETPTTPPHQVKDPVLYPAEEVPSSPAQTPLFAPAELEDHRRIVDDHVRARSPTSFAGVIPPKREEYELALTFRSQVMKHYTANRKAWLLKERAFLEADRRAHAQRYHTILPAAKPAAAKPTRARGDRVQKPQSAPRPIRTHPGAATTGPIRPTPRVSATPEPSRRVVAPNREDKDFRALPDYCPPLNSLPNRPNSLKVDWKGQPVDLSNDPHVSLLHPDEVSLASNLRLDCATYLTSKRRIFERRLLCLRNNKEFRKTDAQQACKIDVNKASKLWTAFDRVGWLDADWVRQYL